MYLSHRQYSEKYDAFERCFTVNFTDADENVYIVIIVGYPLQLELVYNIYQFESFTCK